MNKRAAIETLKISHKLLREIGIEKHGFPCFGTLLGLVRENGLIGHDGDTDICLLADRITKDQESAYFDGLMRLGMFEHRDKRVRRHDTGRFMWHSMKKELYGTKCCTWYFQQYRGYYFHGKGRNWVKKIGPTLKPEIPRNYHCISKGVKSEYFSRMVKKSFLGLKWWIPLKYGNLLDHWYGYRKNEDESWAVPKRGGSSLEEILWVVPDWAKPKKWYIRRRS